MSKYEKGKAVLAIVNTIFAGIVAYGIWQAEDHLQRDLEQRRGSVAVDLLSEWNGMIRDKDFVHTVAELKDYLQDYDRLAKIARGEEANGVSWKQSVAKRAHLLLLFSFYEQVAVARASNAATHASLDAFFKTEAVRLHGLAKKFLDAHKIVAGDMDEFPALTSLMSEEWKV